MVRIRLGSADGLAIANANDPQPGQRGLGHLDADSLSGPQKAQATGVERLGIEGNLAAIVEQHAARTALVVESVHAGLHATTLVLGCTKHHGGVPADPDGDRIAQPLVVVDIGAQCRQVQIQAYAVT
jgi:hypothetical protein